MCALVCRDRGQLPPGPRIHDPYALPDARVATLDMHGLVPAAPGLLDVHSQEPTAPHLTGIVAPADDASDRDIPPRHGALPTASPVDAFPSARYEAALESLRAASTVEEVATALEACRALLLRWGDSHRRWEEVHWTLLCACPLVRAMCAIECVVCLSDCVRPEGVRRQCDSGLASHRDFSVTPPHPVRRPLYIPHPLPATPAAPCTMC
jgi:hypothetical protein